MIIGVIAPPDISFNSKSGVKWGDLKLVGIWEATRNNYNYYQVMKFVRCLVAKILMLTNWHFTINSDEINEQFIRKCHYLMNSYLK